MCHLCSPTPHTNTFVSELDTPPPSLGNGDNLPYPGMDYLGIGYDIVKGNPEGDEMTKVRPATFDSLASLNLLSHACTSGLALSSRPALLPGRLCRSTLASAPPSWRSTGVKVRVLISIRFDLLPI